MFTKHLEISALVFLTQQAFGYGENWYEDELTENPNHDSPRHCPNNYEKTEFGLTGWCHENCAEGWSSIGTMCFRDCHTDGFTEPDTDGVSQDCNKPYARSRNPVWKWWWEADPPGKSPCFWGAGTRCDPCTSGEYEFGDFCHRTCDDYAGQNLFNQCIKEKYTRNITDLRCSYNGMKFGPFVPQGLHCTRADYCAIHESCYCQSTDEIKQYMDRIVNTCITKYQ